jgi:hypothetical protein
LDQLIEKRSSLMEKLNDRDSPALRLPDEISLEVLMNCLPVSNSPITPGYDEMTPFQLGHICRSWRYIVWSTPRLWSVVTLDVCFHNNLSLVVEWLQRSGQKPLSICLTWNPFSPDGERFPGNADPNKQDLWFSNLMGIIGRHAKRWHTIDFRVPEESYDSHNFVHGLQDGQFPLLTSMSFHDLDSRMEGNLGMVYPMLRNAPRLHEIHLTNCTLVRYIFPMNQVTQVSLREATLKECWTVFNDCPLLTHCTIIDIKKPKKALKFTVTRRLKSLTLNSVHGVPELLNHLTTPVLLELTVETGTSTLAFSNILSLTTRSSCSLKRLSLSGAHIPGIQLKDCHQMSSLIELSLSSHTLCNEFMHLLDPVPIANVGSSRCLLPKLQVFEYGGNPDIHSLDVKSVLLSRWKLSREGKVALLCRVTLRILSRKPNTPAISQHPQRIADGMYLSVVFEGRAPLPVRG